MADTSYNYTNLSKDYSRFQWINNGNRLRIHEEKYSSDLSTPYPPALASALHDLSHETARDFARSCIMMVPETQRKLLYHLVNLLNAQNVLEIGTYTGATAIVMAAALPKNGKLVTIDINPKAVGVAHKYIKRLQLEDRVDIRLGSAMESLQVLAKEVPRRQFDIISLDADMEGYISYFDFIMDNDLLSDKGVIVADDALYAGLVHRSAGYEGPLTDVSAPSASEAEALSKPVIDFNKHALQDRRVQVTILPVFNGVSLISKRKKARL